MEADSSMLSPVGEMVSTRDVFAGCGSVSSAAVEVATATVLASGFALLIRRAAVVGIEGLLSNFGGEDSVLLEIRVDLSFGHGVACRSSALATSVEAVAGAAFMGGLAWPELSEKCSDWGACSKPGGEISPGREFIGSADSAGIEISIAVGSGACA
jgi:hypothetical protein